MASPRAVLDHILDSITAASGAQAAGARMRLEAAEPGGLDDAAQLAIRLASARHNPRPRVDRRSIVILCADHGVTAESVADGGSPTAIAVQHVASGKAAVNAVARTSKASLVIVDCGIAGAESQDLGPGVLRFRVCDGTMTADTGPAMTPIDALMSVQTGIALMFSLADEGVDVVTLGQLAGGAAASSAAIVAAMVGGADVETDAETEAALAANPTARADVPLEVLACFGGPDTGVMVGMILGAASINVPVLLDDHGTSAAAVIARGLAPDVAGYLFASHGGTTPAHKAALTALGLTPLIEHGLSHGEGAGAGLALPHLDAAAARLAADDPHP